MEVVVAMVNVVTVMVVVVMVVVLKVSAKLERMIGWGVRMDFDRAGG